jgi:hypothetical protein
VKVSIREREHPGARRCALCHDGLDLEPARTCAGCGTATHLACLADARGCPTLGCSAPRPDIVLTWSDLRRQVNPLRALYRSWFRSVSMGVLVSQASVALGLALIAWRRNFLACDLERFGLALGAFMLVGALLGISARAGEEAFGRRVAARAAILLVGGLLGVLAFGALAPLLQAPAVYFSVW